MNDFISRELKLGCALTPIAIPIGMVISYVVMGIVMWDFGAAFTILAASIICTLGISLILWIPLWYVVGYGVLLTLRFTLPLFGMDISGIFDRNKAKSASDISQPAQATLSRDQQALLNYIKKARAKGLRDEEISQNLARNGWQVNSVRAAFQMAEGGV